MKAYELMRLAAENPQKYEEKKYKVDEAYDRGGNAVTELYVTGHGDLRNSANGYRAYIGYDTELKEIQQPVPFMEAVRAYSEGRGIRHNLDGGYKEFHPCGIKPEDETFSMVDILHGEWYIV
jgi:hypothetical protein